MSLLSLVVFFVVVIIHVPQPITQPIERNVPSEQAPSGIRAADGLARLAIKQNGSHDDYSRQKFGNGWTKVAGCDTRNIILNRDLDSVKTNELCQVISGTLHDPYSGRVITFLRGPTSSGQVQIDHVVALSNAWQTGAQLLTATEREAFANDPLELLAVAGEENQKKSGSSAADWLPSNKVFHCPYVARQIAVKLKYYLWVSQEEYNAMKRVLTACPEEYLPVP